MKAAIHPAYNEVRVMCACGNSFMTRSTHKGDIHVEICSNCHPFFTGKQKLLDTAGRVERFRRKYAKVEPAKKERHGQVRILALAFGRGVCFLRTGRIGWCASSGTMRRRVAGARRPRLHRALRKVCESMMSPL